MPTVAEHIRKHAGDTRVAIRFEDETWTWDEYVQACAAARRLPPRPPARRQAAARGRAARQHRPST